MRLCESSTFEIFDKYWQHLQEALCLVSAQNGGSKLFLSMHVLLLSVQNGQKTYCVRSNSYLFACRAGTSCNIWVRMRRTAIRMYLLVLSQTMTRYWKAELLNVRMIVKLPLINQIFLKLFRLKSKCLHIWWKCALVIWVIKFWGDFSLFQVFLSSNFCG